MSIPAAVLQLKVTKHTKATWRYRRPSVAGICKKAAPQSQLCYSDEMKGYGTKDELTSVHCIFQDVYPLYASTTHTEKANDAIQSCQFILISWGSGHREVQSASHLFASASQPGPHLLPRQWTRPDREARQLSRKSWEKNPWEIPWMGTRNTERRHVSHERHWFESLSSLFERYQPSSIIFSLEFQPIDFQTTKNTVEVWNQPRA